ncbi:hypothetical protein RMN56_19525 [Micromonospora halotolerans]|uniref:DUF202 domain-containing protein n=1 Tax=Micromonospora halotolerans TaxID=709879 RepID=A0ABY9ZQG3_9ACTN|nr:hypothetical protein [Micromonospora halotolerans]WNM37358.1 hypothetical protein RMN56_19525 [Micromonospora halotolerans]
MVAGSNKGRRKPRKPTSPEERAQAERDIRGAVADLQVTAYANLRNAIANVAIFFGFVGVFAMVIDAADGLRLTPMLVLVLAGLAGAAYYPARHRHELAVRLLLASSALVVIGLAGLVLFATVLEP